MKAGYQIGKINDLAMYFATELALRNHELFHPDDPKRFVEFFFSSYDALLEELSSQDKSRERGILFAVLDVD